MADIADTVVNIEMRKRNATNDGWIVEHPKTTSQMVVMESGKDLETDFVAHKADNLNYKRIVSMGGMV